MAGIFELADRLYRLRNRSLERCINIGSGDAVARSWECWTAQPVPNGGTFCLKFEVKELVCIRSQFLYIKQEISFEKEHCVKSVNITLEIYICVCFLSIEYADIGLGVTRDPDTTAIP